MADNSDFTFQRVKRQTLNRTVYEAIKKSILSGELPAGVKLSEVQMGNQLGVSATPVREAFRMLSMEGLVTIDPWKGAVVQGYSQQAAVDNSQCREALELLALHLFMQKMNETDLAALQYMITQAEQTALLSDFVETSSAIHNLWIDRCGNSRIGQLMSQLNTVVLRERNVSATDEIRKKEIISEHRQILAALRARDEDAAAKALSLHIVNGFEYGKRKNQGDFS